MLKSSRDTCKDEINNLFKDLNQSTYRCPLSMKQFLFDQLANRYLKSLLPNKQNFDCWDRAIRLLPFLFECLADENITEDYQFPVHPSLVVIDDRRQPLLDLFFFCLQRYFNEQPIRCELFNEIRLPSLQNTKNRRPAASHKDFSTITNLFSLTNIGFIIMSNRSFT